MSEKAEIETVVRVHMFHGYASTLTFKDNPDAPEIGCIIVHEEDELKQEIYLFKEDLPQILEALKRFIEDNK